MALDMDPELRRRLIELGQFHDDWVDRHQIDGGTGPDCRPPSANAEREFWERGGEIMGIDPTTGLYRDPVRRARPVARAHDEAQVYLDLRGCKQCGSIDTVWQSALVDAGDGSGDLLRRYRGVCGECGNEREFRFELPDRPAVSGADDVVFFGGPEPSALVDPGEWLYVADLSATSAGLVGADPDVDEQRFALAAAIAAIDEILKFIPAGADAVPESAFTSSRGFNTYRREPGRFERGRLQVVRDSYALELGR